MKNISKIAGTLFVLGGLYSASAMASAEELMGTMVSINSKCYLKSGDELLRLDVVNDAYLRPYLSQKITVEGQVAGESIDVNTIVATALENEKSKVIYDWTALDLELYR